VAKGLRGQGIKGGKGVTRAFRIFNFAPRSRPRQVYGVETERKIGYWGLGIGDWRLGIGDWMDHARFRGVEGKIFAN